MNQPGRPNRRFVLGSWRVLPDLNRLVPLGADEADSRARQLEPRIMQTLVLLAEYRGQVLSRQHIMDTLWGESVVVESALTRAVSELRTALDDDPREPRYIETIRKGGYRLIMAVTWDEEGDDEALPTGEAPEPRFHSTSRPRSGSPWRIWLPLLVLAVLVMLATRPWRPGAPAGSPFEFLTESRPLTSLPGVESNPAVSPDGRLIAFAHREPGAARHEVDLYVLQRGEAAPRRLTSTPGLEGHPCWSPDGRSIAFARLQAGQASIWTVPAIGGHPRKVADISSWPMGMDWSPDGRSIAFAATIGRSLPDLIQVLDVQTHQIRRITEPDSATVGDTSPRWSHDGRRLAFVRGDRLAIQDVFIVPAEGGPTRRVTRGHRQIKGLDWSSDGSTLIISSCPVNRARLWRVDPDDGDLERLGPAPEGLGNLSVASTAEVMVYETCRAEMNIWEAHADGTAPVRPLITSTRWDSEPHISFDGQRIAFVSTRSGSKEIWTCRRDGSEPQRLTWFEGAELANPTWSPDGQRLVFSEIRDDVAVIHVIDAGGGQPHAVSTGEFHDIASSWSMDGRWIYFNSNRNGRWEVWRLPSDGGEPEQVTHGGGLTARESPDGRNVFFVKSRHPGIWRQPVAGGEAECLASYFSLGDCSNWCVQNDGFCFATYGRDGLVLAGSDLQGQDVRELAPVPGIAMGSLCSDPDGVSFLYARLDVWEVDLMVVDLD